MRQAIRTDALPRLDGATVAILRSKWHAEIVESMYAACVRVLDAKGVAHTGHVLPGCFEFPHAANVLAAGAKPPHALVCFGVVLKGETRHFEMIVNECVRGLGEVSRRRRVPVINEILPVADLDQARARAADDEFNKGVEAAAAAIEIIHWQRQLATSP